MWARDCKSELSVIIMKIKYIKKAITKYGFLEEDFIYNQTILPKLSEYALAQLYDELDGLHKKYLATLN